MRNRVHHHVRALQRLEYARQNGSCVHARNPAGRLVPSRTHRRGLATRIARALRHCALRSQAVGPQRPRLCVVDQARYHRNTARNHSNASFVNAEGPMSHWVHHSIHPDPFENAAGQAPQRPASSRLATPRPVTEATSFRNEERRSEKEREGASSHVIFRLNAMNESAGFKGSADRNISSHRVCVWKKEQFSAEYSPY